MPSVPPTSGSSGFQYDPVDPTAKSTSWDTRPFTWNGMHFDSDQAKKFWTNIVNMMNTQISKDLAKAKKASERLKKTAIGEDPDE